MDEKTAPALRQVRELNRYWCGIELKTEYFQIAQDNVTAAAPRQLSNMNPHYPQFHEFLSENVVTPFYLRRLQGLQSLTPNRQASGR